MSTFALNKISDPHIFSFDAAAYSRFKFGDNCVAQQFGEDLADGFIDLYLSRDLSDKQMVVVPSPYSFIPTATHAMKNFFVFRLNRWLADHQLQVLQETKIHRTITYKDDYGALNAEERMKLIGNDSFHIDKDFLRDKTLLFLDDIKITGSHERMILKMVDSYGITNDMHMVYFAELVDNSIHPNIENYLNYYDIRTIFDVDKIIKSGNFCFNTRVVKYILNYNYESFCIFLQDQTRNFINELYDLALGNSYHTMACYTQNLEHTKMYLSEINKKNIVYGN